MLSLDIRSHLSIRPPPTTSRVFPVFSIAAGRAWGGVGCISRGVGDHVHFEG